MAEQMNLDDVLSDKPAAPPPPAEVKEAPAGASAELQTATPVSSTRRAHQVKERAAREGRERDPETGKFVEVAEEEEKKEAPKEPPRQDLTEKERAFLRQAEDERHKRQLLETQLLALQAQRAPQQPAQEPASFQDNPEGYINALAQQMQIGLVETRVNMSEAIARKNYKDYQEKCNKWKEMVQTNPGLFQQTLQTPDPAEFVYNIAKNQMEIEAAGGIQQYREKVENEAKIKAETEIREQIRREQERARDKAAALPPSLTNVQGVPAPSRAAWGGPTPLDSILKS